MKRTLFIAACLLMACCSKNIEDGSAIVKAGDTVPEFTITSVDGASVFNSGSAGKAVLIYLFWSECEDCKEQTPQIASIRSLWEDSPEMMLVAIARGGENATLEQAVAYWNSTGIGTPLYYDADRSIFNLFARSGVPRLYLIDKNGIVRWAPPGGYSIYATHISDAISSL